MKQLNCTPGSWLWPDRAIGKRESRRLREEHNAVVNINAELLDQRNALLEALLEVQRIALEPIAVNQNCGERTQHKVNECLYAARAALARATDTKE